MTLRSKLRASHDLKQVTSPMSTSEQQTGRTWVDGRTIYEKVLTFDAGPNGEEALNLPHGIVEPFYLIDMRGMLAVGGEEDATFFPIPYVNALGVGMVEILKVLESVGLTAYSDYSAWRGHVVLTYVKG